MLYGDGESIFFRQISPLFPCLMSPRSPDNCTINRSSSTGTAVANAILRRCDSGSVSSLETRFANASSSPRRGPSTRCG